MALYKYVYYHYYYASWYRTVDAFKAPLDNFWQHQLVKFDFTADLTGTGNRSEEVIKLYCLFMIVYNDDADLKVSDTCVRNSLLSWVAGQLINYKLEVDGKPVGERLLPDARTHVQTDGQPENIVHPARLLDGPDAL